MKFTVNSHNPVEISIEANGKTHNIEFYPSDLNTRQAFFEIYEELKAYKPAEISPTVDENGVSNIELWEQRSATRCSKRCPNQGGGADMPQYDGYVRISTENDTSSAKRSTEELGNTIHDAMDTTPVDKMTSAMDNLNSSTNGADTSGLNDMRDGVDKIGDSAISTGDLIRANLISDTVMSGLKQIAGALKSTGEQSIQTAMSNETAFAKASTLLKGDDLEKYFEGLIDISNRTGVAFADLAESMYSALSAGVPQDNVLSFVEDTVNLSNETAGRSIDVTYE